MCEAKATDGRRCGVGLHPWPVVRTYLCHDSLPGWHHYPTPLRVP